MAGSDYSLRLRATIDTTQVQQELKKLRAAQVMAFDQGGSVTSKGLQGVSNMQKIEVQLTKLNSSISGLQRAIEQLSRMKANYPNQANIPNKASGLPYLPPGMNKSQFNSWMGSKEYARLNRRVIDLLKSKG